MASGRLGCEVGPGARVCMFELRRGGKHGLGVGLWLAGDGQGIRIRGSSRLFVSPYEII